MTAELTLVNLEQFCRNSTGTTDQWHGNKATYKWTMGKKTDAGIVNGVVRKLAALDANGQQIWVVAGSFKILPDGKITRFTGLTKKNSEIVMGMNRIIQTATKKQEEVTV